MFISIRYSRIFYTPFTHLHYSVIFQSVYHLALSHVISHLVNFLEVALSQPKPVLREQLAAVWRGPRATHTLRRATSVIDENGEVFVYLPRFSSSRRNANVQCYSGFCHVLLSKVMTSVLPPVRSFSTSCLLRPPRQYVSSLR